MRFEILVFDGVDELDAIGPLELLRGAAQAGADFDVRLVTAGDVDEVVGSHGLRFAADGTMSERADVVVVPGGGWLTRSPVGAWREAGAGRLPSAIADAARGGAVIASVCTGAMLVAAAGLAAGRRMATHRGAIDELRAAGAVIVGDRVVDDGDLVSAGGVTSGLDLALWLVERFGSAELADLVGANAEYRRARPARRPTGRWSPPWGTPPSPTSRAASP